MGMYCPGEYGGGGGRGDGERGEGGAVVPDTKSAGEAQLGQKCELGSSEAPHLEQ